MSLFLRSVFILLLSTTLFSKNMAQSPQPTEGHVFFLGRIFKHNIEVWEKELMMQLNQLPLDNLRYLDENRKAVIVNEEGEELYLVELTSLKELKDEFDRKIPSAYPNPVSDKRKIVITQQNDGTLVLNVR